VDAQELNVRLQRLERLVAGLPAECSLWDDLQFVKKHVARSEASAAALAHEACQLSDELRRLGDEAQEARRRNASTARMLVAVRRLHATLRRSELLLALEEIVAALVGCEELALFEIGGAPGRLSELMVVGAELATLGAAGIAPDAIACAAAGEAWIAPDQGAGDRDRPRPTACVPLRAGERVVGVLALYRLLPQKARLEAADVELLELLEDHLGVALVASAGDGRR
jgi:hypothetical protein